MQASFLPPPRRSVRRLGLSHLSQTNLTVLDNWAPGARFRAWGGCPLAGAPRTQHRGEILAHCCDEWFGIGHDLIPP
jgi:hypothetical protein